MTPTEEQEYLDEIDEINSATAEPVGHIRADWTEGEFFAGQPVKTSQLAEAIHAAQSELRNPKKDSQNPFFNSSYLGLDSLLELLRGVFNKHGISILQDVVSSPAGVGCKTLLLHKSGEVMSFGPLLLPAVKQDPQAYGSAISYARRYHLQAVAGVAGVDDDAESAMPARASVASPRALNGGSVPESGDVSAVVASVGRKTDKGPYCVTFADHGDFFTFDKDVATQAELSRSLGAVMTFKWKANANPKFGRNIVSEKPKP